MWYCQRGNFFHRCSIRHTRWMWALQLVVASGALVAPAPTLQITYRASQEMEKRPRATSLPRGARTKDAARGLVSWAARPTQPGRLEAGVRWNLISSRDGRIVLGILGPLCIFMKKTGPLEPRRTVIQKGFRVIGVASFENFECTRTALGTDGWAPSYWHGHLSETPTDWLRRIFTKVAIVAKGYPSNDPEREVTVVSRTEFKMDFIRCLVVIYNLIYYF